MRRTISYDEFMESIRNKAEGMEDTAYKSTFSSVVDIPRTLLSIIPTKMEYDRKTRSGWPVVKHNSRHIAANMVTAMRPIPNTAAIVKELGELARKGLIVRVPGWIEKSSANNPHTRLQKALIYVQAGGKLEKTWTMYDESDNNLRDFSYKRSEPKTKKTYKPSSGSNSKKMLLSDLVISKLPDRPTSEYYIDPEVTAGTTRNVLRQCGIDPTDKNVRVVSALLCSFANGRTRKDSNIKMVKRWDNREGVRGRRTVNVFYRASK